MAFAADDFLTGYQYLASGASTPAAGVFIPLATLTGLDATEAAAGTGDGRKVLMEILIAAQTAYDAMSSKPTKMTMSKTRSVSATQAKDSFSLVFTRDITIGDVTSET